MLDVKDKKQSYVGGTWFLTATVTKNGKDYMKVEFNGNTISFYRCHSLDNILIMSEILPKDSSSDKQEQLDVFNRCIPFMMRHAADKLTIQIQSMIN